MITCNLMEMPEYTGCPSEKMKFGRYHGSAFWDIKGYGQKKWVIGTYIEVEDQSLFDEMEAPELVEACLETLNTPPPRKKYAKKDPKPKYGVLEHYKCQVVERSGKKVLSALLVTSKKKSKFFWGKG